MSKPTATSFLLPFISFFLQSWHLSCAQSVSLTSLATPLHSSVCFSPLCLLSIFSLSSAFFSCLLFFPTHSCLHSPSHMHISLVFFLSAVSLLCFPLVKLPLLFCLFFPLILVCTLHLISPVFFYLHSLSLSCVSLSSCSLSCHSYFVCPIVLSCIFSVCYQSCVSLSSALSFYPVTFPIHSCLHSPSLPNPLLLYIFCLLSLLCFPLI
jgi:hypothetical protein